MKKIVTILVVMLGLTTTTQAQRGKKGNTEQLTIAQKTELAVKKMTLKLDLSPNQARQIQPLLAEKIADRKNLKKERKALKESGKKLTANQRYEMQNAKLDRMIAFKNDMKRILNEKQYEKFEKMAMRKMHKAKKKMKNRHRQG